MRSRTSSVQRISVEQIQKNFGPANTEKPFNLKWSDIVIGAHVRFRDGKTGTIRYIDDDTISLIGIKLDSMSHKGHGGRGRFKAPIGRGYFAKRSHIVAISKVGSKSSVSQRKRHWTNKIKLAKSAIFDSVILKSGERGRVVFIGDVHFGTDKMLGIELEKWSPNGHNGSIYGKTYFIVRDGHGLLVPMESVYAVDRERQHTSMYADYSFIAFQVDIFTP